MKRFINKITILFLPLVMSLILVESYIVYHPNSFNTKAHFLNSNLENIEFLFFGSSHTDGNVNPKYISNSSANIAHGSQDIQLDSALFFKYSKRLKKLKKVIIELDYHTLEAKHNPDFYRFLWYYKYYDINLGDYKPYNKFSLYLSNTNYFNKYLIRQLNPFSKSSTSINKYGFTENTSGIFKKLNFNEEKIKKISKARGGKTSNINYEFNKSKIISIINYCDKNNIEVVFLKNPQYLTYTNSYIKEKEQRRTFFLDSLISNGKIKVLDYEFDKRFNVTDFNNGDHLNTKGAKKLSQLIDEELKKQVKTTIKK